MDEKIHALHHNQPWTLVPSPPNKNIVRCQWVFCTKFHPNATVENYKVHLVAK